ncbi:serine/threonine protein kinase [Pontiella agarivorans]|uniref:Serine/threonine-protein kinase n=1 Tax=Pontiella agarivorans TaxID=3038953 RepID=A0ABU5MY28_9BACT|nr:serine/threonine-protein kinase [Pontiella agarivorans]MDZ8119068.1 serine/threonine-protein kinase [Pontiella agarivorans]
MKNDYENLEKEYAGLSDELARLCNDETLQLDPEEERRLTPIIEDLKGDTAHYSEPVFVCEGGEKKIFKVRDLRTDRIVAMAKPLVDADNLSREQFLREARLTACLQHPNIMTIHDLGLDKQGIPFFTMEFVPGDTLKDIVKKLAKGVPEYVERYSRERLLEIFVKICDALSYAHSRGVVHLDIKPANIKVGPFGEVVVCDWGLSRILSGGFDEYQNFAILDDDRPNSDLLNDLSPSSMVKGTPGFIAPEQIDHAQPTSEQTDLYTLGAVLYFILTYRPPVIGDSMQDILKKTVNGEVVPVARAAGGRFIPRGLESVVLKALALHPKDRYASVKDLRDELDRFLHGFATEAQQAGVLERTGLLIRRRPVVFLVIGLFLILLALVLSFSFVRIVHEKKLAVAAQHQSEENLRLYMKETEHTKEVAANIRNATLSLFNPRNLLEADTKAQLLDLHLREETNPERKQFLARSIAVLHFVRQHFVAALDYFRQTDILPEEDLFYALSLKYARVKGTDNGWLTPDDLRQIILTLPAQHKDVMFAMAFYYFKDQKDVVIPEEVLPLIETLLDRLNAQGQYYAERTTLVLTDTENGRMLSLSGDPYSIFTLPLPADRNNTNVLHPLKLYSLDLTKGFLFDPSELYGSGIKELNISGINWLKRSQIHIIAMLKLERLIHSLEESDEYLAEILPGVELVRVKNPL